MQLTEAANAARFWLRSHSASPTHAWGPLRIHALSQRIIPDDRTWNRPRALAFYNTIQPTNKILWHDPLPLGKDNALTMALGNRLAASSHFSHAIPAGTITAPLGHETIPPTVIDPRLWTCLPTHAFEPFVSAYTLRLPVDWNPRNPSPHLRKSLLVVMQCQSDIPLVPLEGLEHPISNFIQNHLFFPPSPS